MPGITPGLPLGLPKDATTVRVQDGRTLTTNGPFVDIRGAVGGYYFLEANDLDEAVKVASRIPGGASGWCDRGTPSREVLVVTPRLCSH
jgi:hypothetical protein